ncbi:sugar phosphate isomerase/epimerase family protein [Tuwongella immobilis]|uniref:Xylose isomerase-like TIM barrel domain-containing protein n=1 Tax=Tuwongella immobilis TaxID=692036 RepID=A0A6C2YXH3_9BACT|nr:sugar phosphate isomerase/epimerase [Tuwongella immobilis]VIP05512.1 Sugar phosphate isomerase/epimerase OS=Singulisphaera acidiphila (strain ATCC BAA-1392 / DSM 18658 / VKM B-2454 / MOB10) GN=Sinac_5014 PE=4 SV=1: AP_endonuc_2 [Tuwongella immobilis]VTS08380.1 Sugar phosphate isomerase/epimerase OS=Singulisphaera acidiphila (strain ATCC BAA-1392 / DSM 18658 / VKM B-2454 / MOB10) GN=Sinac_5014 PE=4 SV=1: AP_endonuc_2 [Tuwongella immobilis]
MKPCIAQATILTSSFADDLDAMVAGGCTAMEVWMTKLETHLEQHSVDSTKELLAEKGVTPIAAAYQGGLLLSQGEARKSHFEHFRSRLNLCQTFDIPLLLVIADFTTRIDGTAFERALVSLQQAAQWAAAFNIRLGLEFRANATFCNNLDTALTLIEQCNEPNLGIVLDAFHYHCGPSKPEDLQRLTAENLALVQVADLAGVPRELAGDSDRIMPGEGDLHYPPILKRLREIHYSGYLSLELFNPTLWQMKSSQVTQLGMTALNSLMQIPA